VLGLAHPPFGWRLDRRERHVAQLLGGAGYRTVLVGMQHLVEHGSERELGYEQVFPVAPACVEADRAVSLLGELAAQDRPFYLEVGFEEPHRPYDFGNARPDDSRGLAVPPFLPDMPESRLDFAAFQGAIRQMDAAVGVILAGVDELGLTSSLCVVFATDHGMAMPRAKCTLYDPGIEVALLWRWPAGGVERGRVISDLVSNVDVAPTLLEGLGLSLDLGSPGFDGQSLWPLLSVTGRYSSSYVPRSEVFVEKTFHTYYEPMRAIRTAHHKLIVNFEISTTVDVPTDIRASPIYPLLLPELDTVRAPVELYDLDIDPWEQRNQADHPNYTAIRAELSHRLLRWMQERTTRYCAVRSRLRTTRTRSSACATCEALPLVGGAEIGKS
jgi:arylsulfatase A-like enzyme